MKNRRDTVLVLGLAALLAPASLLRAEEPPTTTQGSVELDGYCTIVDGSPTRRWSTSRRATTLNVLVSSHEHWGSLILSSEGKGKGDQKHHLSLDVQRALRVKAGYEELTHRLPHDPMTNLTAAVSDGKFVWNTDLAPQASYAISHSTLAGRAELTRSRRPPSASPTASSGGRGTPS
jgi:hypothetical protein